MEPTAPDWRAIGGPQAQPREPASGVASRPLPPARSVALLAGAFLATVVLGALVALLLMPTTGGVVIDTGEATRIGALDSVRPGAVELGAGTGSETFSESRALVVDVEGAVTRPGLVRVPVGGRVGEVLELAGGFAATADLAAARDSLNLAQEVTDGLKIVVPAIGDGDGRSTVGVDDPGQPSGGLVDLNRAGEADLDALPGVGPATIAKILAAREETPFRSVDELRSRGIVGEATFGKLRDLVTVGR